MDKNPSTILITDDEPAMRKALGELLVEEGYDVEFAKNGAEAVAKAAEIVPDLVLLDVMMPDMDGFAVCRKLRADRLLAQVPIIMITSLGDRASRLRGFEAGADDYVSKPIDEPELLTRVKTTTHLNRYRRLLEEQINREMAEEALQISETRYRQLFDRVPVGLYRSTPDGETLEANQALIEMLGYPDVETFLATNATEAYIDPKDRQRWQAKMEQEEVVLGFETQWRRYDETTTWVQESSRIIRDEKGQPLYYAGSVEDITERKRAEEALEHSLQQASRGQRLLLALSEAAQAVQRARTSDEVYRTIGDEIVNLGYHVLVLILTEDNEHLVTTHVTLEPDLLQAAEKLLGFTARDYRIPLKSGSFYQRILAKGETAFTTLDAKSIVDALPKAIRPLTGKLVDLLGLGKSIFAPLQADGEIYGLMVVWGNDLQETDVPAITAFAGQAAISIENAQLYQAAQQERDSAQRYLDIAGVMLVAIDAKGEITLINRKGCDILGCEEQKILSKNWFDTCLPSEIRETVKSVFNQLITGEIEPVEYYENPVLTKSGEQRLIAWHNTVLRDQAGNIVGTLSSGEDVTERRQAEEAYRALVDHSLQGLVILQDGHIVFANQALAEIGGYTVEELLALSPEGTRETIHPEDRETVVGHYEDQLKGKSGPEEFAFRAIQKDGTVRWLEAYTSRIEYQGRPAVQTAYVDITERKQAEEALRQSEAKFRSVIEQASDGVILTDEEGHITEWNQAQERMTGLKQGEVLGQPVWNIQHQIALEENRNQALYERLKASELEFLRTGQSPWVGQLLEYEILHSDGTHCTIQTVAFPVKTEKGFIIGSANRDITEKKQAEAAMHVQRDLGITLASTSDLMEALHQVLEAALQIEGIDCGGLYLVDRLTGQLDLVTHRGLSPQFIERTSHYAADAPQTRLIKAGKSIYQRYNRVVPIEQDPVRQDEGLRALSIIPIRYEEQVVAVLNLASHTHDETSASARDALEAIAAQVGSVIARIEAEKALRESEERHRTLFETMTQGVLYWDAEGRVISANPAAERILGLTLEQIQGSAPIDPRWKMIHQDGSEMPEETLLAVVSLRPGEEIHNITIGFFNPELDSYRWVNVNAVPLFRPNESKPYRVHTIFEDITDRVQAEAEIKQRNQELAALNEIGQSIVSTLDLQETLTTITDHTTRLMGMAATSVTLLDEANHDLYFAAASGEGSDFVVGKRLVMGQGVTGWVIEHGQPALIPDVSQDDRWDSGFDAEGGFTTHSILCVPLKSKGRVIGALEAINKEYGFSQDDLHLLNALVAPVSTAIENARLFEQVRVGREQLQTLSRRLVEMQEAERAHVARELHDETGQALSSMLLNLGLMEQEADQPDIVIARINEMIVMVDDMLENLHRLAMNLRPATLDHLGLVPALEQYVETFNQQYNIKTQFEAVGLGKKRLLPEVETALYRIVQESLTNVVRHAQATQADVLVERRNDQVITIIEDNGTGFDPETAMQASRLGLLGMRERAEMLNGKLVIESAPSSGTTVLVEVPYKTD